MGSLDFLFGGEFIMKRFAIFIVVAGLMFAVSAWRMQTPGMTLKVVERAATGTAGVLIATRAMGRKTRSTDCQESHHGERAAR